MRVLARASGIAAVWALLVDGMAAAGTAMIVILMAIICSDVVARNMLGASLPLISELSALTLVMIVYLQLGAAVRHNRLARADIFIEALRLRRPRAAVVLGALFDIAGAGMLGLIAWSTVRILETDMRRGEYIGVTGVLTVPTWPFRAVILFGMAVAAVQFAIALIEAFRPDRDGSGADRP
jgi:TRAP-type C4-dicarboxylate transport system permease small subunit